MPPVTHTFVAGLRAETELCYAAGTRWNRLHLTQSALDGACGPHCVVMALMILTGIARREIERLATSKNPMLVALWERAAAHWFSGTNGDDIGQYVNVLSPALQCRPTSTGSTKRIAETASAIQAGAVPLVRVAGPRLDHWILVTGFEQEAGSKSPRALLLLDPGAPAPWLSYFNARLDLGVRRSTGVTRTASHALRYVDGERWSVDIEELVILSRGQPP